MLVSYIKYAKWAEKHRVECKMSDQIKILIISLVGRGHSSSITTHCVYTHHSAVGPWCTWLHASCYPGSTQRRQGGHRWRSGQRHHLGVCVCVCVGGGKGLIQVLIRQLKTCDHTLATYIPTCLRGRCLYPCSVHSPSSYLCRASFIQSRAFFQFSA